MTQVRSSYINRQLKKLKVSQYGNWNIETLNQ